jgi:hypothetical protein
MGGRGSRRAAAGAFPKSVPCDRFDVCRARPIDRNCPDGCRLAARREPRPPVICFPKIGAYFDRAFAIVSPYVVRGPLISIVPTGVHWRLGGSLALPVVAPSA